MASTRRQLVIDADPDAVWGALRRRDALHERLGVRYRLPARRNSPDRDVRLRCGPARGDPGQRLACVDGPYTHHNGAAEVLAEHDGRARLVWISDLRPDALAEATAQAMEQGLDAIKRTLERRNE